MNSRHQHHRTHPPLDGRRRHFRHGTVPGRRGVDCRHLAQFARHNAPAVPADLAANNLAPAGRPVAPQALARRSLPRLPHPWWRKPRQRQPGGA